MTISAAQVKELRDKTGAGMMDCKKALIESDGDFEKAIEGLRKKGASVAAKRAERTANEGLVLTKVNDDLKTGYIIEVNCETDFVANSDDFINFANMVLNAMVANNPENLEVLLQSDYNGKNVQEAMTETIGKIGEKIEVSRFEILSVEDGVIVDYIHHGSKLGVMLVAENINQNVEEFALIMKDVAMQIAAMKPLYVTRDEVPKEAVDKEIEIYKEIALKEGKPENIVEKIALGKLNKYYEEVCLMEQSFVKDNTKSIQNLVEEFNKSNSTEAKFKLFRRFHLSDENK